MAVVRALNEAPPEAGSALVEKLVRLVWEGALDGDRILIVRLWDHLLPSGTAR